MNGSELSDSKGDNAEEKSNTEVSSQRVQILPNTRNGVGDQEDEPPGEIVVIDVNATELDLNYSRIREITAAELEKLKSLECLYLRWNLIKKIENLQSLVTLRELELYGNQITTIEGLECLVNLEFLDLSFNRIPEIKGLENLTKLEKLFLSANKISKIENINHLSKLKLLELGNNKIRTIENLEGLDELQSLFLGKNKISKIDRISTLKNLRQLSIQCNRITKIENLNELVDLEELYLSENGIEVIEGLENNLKLNTIDLAFNKIEKIGNLSHLSELTEFWESLTSVCLEKVNEFSDKSERNIFTYSVNIISSKQLKKSQKPEKIIPKINNNNISAWKCLDELTSNKKLATVYLERNPISKDLSYRRKIKLTIPWITQIDATLT